MNLLFALADTTSKGTNFSHGQKKANSVPGFPLSSATICRKEQVSMRRASRRTALLMSLGISLGVLAAPHVAIAETEALAVMPAAQDVSGYSHEEIQAFRETIESAFKVNSPSRTATVYFLPDVNKIGVELSKSDERLVDLILARVPSEAVTISFIEATAQTADSRTTYPPYKAGRQIIDLSAPYGRYCTSAFTMVIAGGPTGGLSQGSTAGHCVYTNDIVGAGVEGLQPFGVANTNSFRAVRGVALGDASLIGFSNQLDATNQLYVNPTLTRSVTSRMSYQDLAPGPEICKSGNKTNVTCGQVTKMYPVTKFSVQTRNLYTDEIEYVDVYNLVCSSIYVEGGDSGAPVYRRTGDSPPTAAAAGIMSLAEYLVYPDETVVFNESCFDPIQHVEETTNTFVRTF